MKTELAPDFLAAVALINGFKPKPMIAAQAQLLARAYHFGRTMASDLDGDFGKNVPGAACGALCAQNLLEVIARVKSPEPSAKGRKLDVWRIPPGRGFAVKAWFEANGIAVTFSSEKQLEIFVA